MTLREWRRLAVMVTVVTPALVAGAVHAQEQPRPAPTHSTAAGIAASPNPVPAGTSEVGSTTIQWTTGDGSPGRVLVSVDGADARLFANGSADSSRADWIRAGSRYEFRLYRDAAPDTIAASVIVTRPVVLRAHSTWLYPEIVAAVVAILTVAFGLVARVRRRAAAPTATPPLDRDPIRVWQFEAGAAILVGFCLWLKLMYSARLMANIPGTAVIETASVATVLLLIAPWLLLPRFWRLVPLFVVDLSATIVLLADELYYRRYLDLITVADLASAPVLFQSFASVVVVSLLRVQDVVYGVDLAALLVGAFFYVRSARLVTPAPFRARARLAAWALAVAVATALPGTWMLWNRRAVAAGNDAYRGDVAGTVGVLPYHLYDALARWFATPEPAPDLGAVRRYLDARRREAVRSPLFGAATGKNLILIQAESLQRFPVGLVIDGQPVTPNLSAFAAESLDFQNFFDQTYHGYTSDGEFTTMTSLHPLPGGSASVTLRTNHYRSLPAILDARGYATLSAVAASGSVWSMTMMHPNHGFELSLFADQFENLEYFHLLSDGQLFAQMLHRITAEPRPFMAYLITSSSHGPFDIPDRYRTLKLPSSLSHNIIGDYLQAVHYLDGAFGQFIDGLRAAGVLDDTVVAIYGDHQAYLEGPAKITALAGFPDMSPFHEWLVEKRIPFIVRLPHAAHASVVTTPTGHLGIAPALLALLGADDEDRVMFGRDATSATPPFVVFRDGGFSDGRVAYAPPHDLSLAPACYRMDTNRAIDCTSIEDGHARAIEELRVSDAVLDHDLIPTLVSSPVPKTVVDLAPPEPYSADLGTAHVVTSAFDILAPAPSGATFQVDNGGGTVRVLFAPIIDEDVRAKEPDGVVFEIRSGSSILWSRRVGPDELETAIAVDVPAVAGHARTAISFITRPVDGSSGAHHATWQRVRFLTGSAARTSSPNRPVNRR